jgi:hypothetical protein
MNKEQRTPFINLAKEINWELCAFCNFALYEDNMKCMHSLIKKIADTGIYGRAGIDCWGYRPSMKLCMVSRIVKTIIKNHLDPERTYFEYDYDINLRLIITIHGQKMSSIPAIFELAMKESI